jgi:PiT family inorganic phosphate transporter
MENLYWMAVATVVIVLFFDYTNGFHDAANIVATIIASRAMTPAQAVVVVGVFEFLGPLLGGTAVANTIGKFVDLSTVDASLAVLILFCGLLGAIVWNLATWWFGIPSSSSHALVGGLAGAVVAAVGSEYVIWGWTPLMHDGKLLGVMKVLVSLLLSPLLGFWCGFLVFRIARKLMAGSKPSANNTLRKLQFVSAATLAFSHGANDAQKSMGMLTLVLLLGGFIPKFEVPFWVVLACATAITLGILSGGWRIVRTLGFAIYRVRPLHALSSPSFRDLSLYARSGSSWPVPRRSRCTPCLHS